MEKTLLILAAGMGSRFGGLKQLEPVGPSGELIIDYSIHDALKAGFTKVVFVIKKENQEDFAKTIGARIAKYVPVEYVYQDNDTLPGNVRIQREKPLGTGHALYCAKDKVKAPFALISADDFYGPEAFKQMSAFLDKEDGKVGIVGYNLASTIPSDKEVKRGIIFADNGRITSLVECIAKKEDDYISAMEIQGTREYKLDLNSSASMLMFCFSLDIFSLLTSLLKEFLEEADLSKDEFILTVVIDKLINENKAKLIGTKGTWMGMSYREDVDLVRKHIQKLVSEGVYEEKLWK